MRKRAFTCVLAGMLALPAAGITGSSSEISGFWSGREFWAPLAASGIAASGVGETSRTDSQDRA